MDTDQFLVEFEEMLNLEPGSLKSDAVIQDLDGWDSVAMLSVVAMVDERYDVVLQGADILECPTVSDLMSMAEGRAKGD